jgi:hypothetical protein
MILFMRESAVRGAYHRATLLQVNFSVHKEIVDSARVTVLL